MRTILEEEKIVLLDQLQKSEEQIEELKKSIEKRDSDKQNIEQCYMRKFRQII